MVTGLFFITAFASLTIASAQTPSNPLVVSIHYGWSGYDGNSTIYMTFALDSSLGNSYFFPEQNSAGNISAYGRIGQYIANYSPHNSIVMIAGLPSNLSTDSTALPF